MKVSEDSYRYKVCPHCKSKPVAVVWFGEKDYSLDVNRVNRTGYLCGNCQKYVTSCLIKYITDRAEMRRDVNRLLTCLSGKETNH